MRERGGICLATLERQHVGVYSVVCSRGPPPWLSSIVSLLLLACQPLGVGCLVCTTGNGASQAHDADSGTVLGIARRCLGTR